MSISTTTEPVWPPGASNISEADVGLIKLFALAEPFLYLVAVLVFLAAAFWLVFKTKASGRYFILSGPLLLVAFWLTEKIANPLFPAPPQSLTHIAVTKFVPSLAAFLIAVGFARLVWWAYRSHHGKQES